LLGLQPPRTARPGARNGPPPPKISVVGDVFEDDVRAALYASKVVAYEPGFNIIIAGANQDDWNTDKGAIATIWRDGRIIRAQFLNRIVDAHANDQSIPTLLVDPHFAEAVAHGEEAWRNCVSTAALSGIPVPGFLIGTQLLRLDGQ